ncbi:MAG: GcrA family cell cycle regulator [Alphaproteobacteria bacterium]|nr:GcrA family cell cycle regulator [Alphaproteobacteria bacterium]
MAEQNNTWTPARIGVLQELWGSGLSAKEIAARLGGGITRNAVIGKAHRLGLSSRPSPIKRVDGKPAVAHAGGAVMKTRLSAPKAMGLRRDVMVGSGAYRNADATRSDMRNDRNEDSEARRLRSSADVGNYSPRLFKNSQPAVQAQAQQCRWPVGDPLKAGFHFCDSMSIPGLPYCYDHACMAYQGSKKKVPAAPREDAPAAAEGDSAQFGAVNNS